MELTTSVRGWGWKPPILPNPKFLPITNLPSHPHLKDLGCLLEYSAKHMMHFLSP